MEKEKDTGGEEKIVATDKKVNKDKKIVNTKSAMLKAKGNSLTGKPLDNVELNPQLGSDKQVSEQSRGGVVLTFGRMNPPTVGHEKLVNKVKDVARSKRATPLVYLSHSQDKKKNPLEYTDKVRFAKTAFGNVIQAANQRTLIDILKTIQNKFSELTLVVGSDRVKEFDNLLQKYNGKDYTFDKIDVVSAGERDPDAEGVAGMSASKMRDAAAKGDERKFTSGLPKGLKSANQAKSIYSLTRVGMQLQEELEKEDLLSEALSIQQRRKRALIMKRFAPKIKRARELAKRRLAPESRIKKRAFKQAREIVRKRVAGKRGQNYANLSPSEKIQVDLAVEKRKKIIGKIAKRIMPKVKQAEFQRLKSFMKGQQMKDAHTDVKKESVDSFNAMFEQYAQNVEITTMDDVIEDMTKLVLDRMITEKQIAALEKRANKSGIDYDLLEQVYVRGLLDTMGDGNAAFNRVNAFVCGGRTAMNEDYDLYQLVEKPDINETFELATEERKPSEPYVKPHGANNRAWKASDKWGHVKYFGKDFKKAAHKHAGIDEAFEEVFEGLEDPKDNPCWKGYEPVGTKKKNGKKVPNCVPVKEDAEQIEEGVNDPAIFKAVFLAGGPGSGKSFMVGKTALPALGYKVINSDPAFEAALKKAGMSTKPEDIYSDKGQSIRQKAKALTKKKMELALSGRLGLVIDGTGKDYERIKRQSERLREEGYEIAMIFVNTNLETALERNNRRSRTLPEAEVKKMWNDVQKNIGRFQTMFRKNLIIVDNSEGSDFDNAALGAYRKLMTWTKKEPKSSIAKQWIKSQMNEDLNLAFEELSQATKERQGIDVVPRKKQDRKKIARVSRPRHDRSDDELNRQGAISHVIGEEGNVQPKASKRLQGTDELVKALKADTPGEGKNLDESFQIAHSAGIGITLTAADLGMKAQGGFALHPSVIEDEDETDEDV